MGRLAIQLRNHRKKPWKVIFDDMAMDKLAKAEVEDEGK
jgi:hypothetical protein